MLKLRKVSEDTFYEVVKLKVTKEQEGFVASNLYSLAQAWLYHKEAKPLAIIDNEQVVGFLMLDYDKAERTMGLWRFMIGLEYQNKGYGKEALKQVIEMANKDPNIDALYLAYVKGNTIAKKLYEFYGFRETGKVEDGEIIMILHTTSFPKLGVLTADKDDMDDFLMLIKTNCYNIDHKLLEDKVIHKKVKRITYYGETIGLIIDQNKYIALKYQAIYQELNRE